MKYVMSIGEFTSINEGFLSDLKSLFGNIKSIFSKDWKNVKCKNIEVRNQLEKADSELSGFTLCKMKNLKGASIIRQELCNYIDALVNAKLQDLENNKDIDKIVLGLKDKDKMTKTDKDNLKNAVDVKNLMSQYGIKEKAYAEEMKTAVDNIKKESKVDPDLERWARTLLGRANSIVNSMIIDKYDGDEKKKKKLEKKLKDQEAAEKKKQDEINKKKQEADGKKIEELEGDRDGVISKSGVNPMKMDGKKAVDTLDKAIDDVKVIKESFEKDSQIHQNMKRDLYIGFEKIAELLDQKDNSDKIANLIVAELDVIYEVIKSKSKELAVLPSENIQAMMIGIAKVLTYALTDDDSVLDGSSLELLARCAIASDRTIGYGIPLFDENKPKDGNIFCVIMQTLKDAKDKAKVFENDKDLLDQMKKKISEVYDMIIKEADRLKKEAEKKAEQEAKK